MTTKKTMSRYKSKASISEKVKDAQGHDVAAVPPGVKINSKEAKILWEQYTDSRQDWTEDQLLTVGKLVHLEIRIRQESNKMATEDVIIETRLGEIKENPRLQAIDRLVKQQSTLIRMIGMNVNYDDAKKLNKRTKSKASAGAPAGASTKDRLKGQLLAMPGGIKG